MLLRLDYNHVRVMVTANSPLICMKVELSAPFLVTWELSLVFRTTVMCGIAFARLLAVYSVLWFVGMYWRCREFRPALGSLRGFSGEWLFMPVGFLQIEG